MTNIYLKKYPQTDEKSGHEKLEKVSRDAVANCAMNSLVANIFPSYLTGQPC